MRNVLRLLPVLSLVAVPALAEEQVIRVMSFNIWYGGEQVSFDQTIAAIRAADADIVGLQEPDGQTARIAQAAGYDFVDLRRHIISRFPLFDSGLGERTETGQTLYPLAALDSSAPHVWAMVAPGQVVALGNLHLSSDPFGPDMARQGATPEEILVEEEAVRGTEIEALMAAFGPVVQSGAPVILTGDFNSPSPQDWTEATIGARDYMRFAFDWPAIAAVEAAGFVDTFRAAHPDPLLRPGTTYTPGAPHPLREEAETEERIDYVFAANARTVTALMMGEAGNPDVDLAITPWPSDHRAVIADIAVDPAAAPALVAVEPRLVTEGESLLVRSHLPGQQAWGAVIVPRGGDAAVDALASVQGIEWWWRQSIRLGTEGLAPGAYDAVLVDAEGTEAARTRFSVIGAGGSALEVLDPELSPGESLSLRWEGAPGMRFDWIGIYGAGDPDLYNYLGFAYTGATLDGTMELTPDLYYSVLEPGDYVVRLMVDDSFVAVASAPFMVLGE